MKVKLSQLEVTKQLIRLLPYLLQEIVNSITEEITYNKKEVEILRQEKVSLEAVLSAKALEVRKTLTHESGR